MDNEEETGCMEEILRQIAPRAGVDIVLPEFPASINMVEWCPSQTPVGTQSGVADDCYTKFETNEEHSYASGIRTASFPSGGISHARDTLLGVLRNTYRERNTYRAH